MIPTWLMVIVPITLIVAIGITLEISEGRPLEEFKIPVFDNKTNSTSLELPEKPIINTGRIQIELLHLIDLEREKFNLAKLKFDPHLSLVTQKHNENMIRLDQYSHIVNGKNVKDRMNENNFECKNPSWDKQRKEIQYRYIQQKDTLVPKEYFDPNFYSSEILNKVWIYDENISNTLFEEWKASKSHYAVIKNKDIRIIGLSVVENPKDQMVYATVNFC